MLRWAIERSWYTLALVLPSALVCFQPAQGLAAGATRQCEEEAAAAGLSEYPDLVRQYVIECMEQYQPGSRDSLESSYRLPEPEPAIEPTAAPDTDPIVTSEPPAADPDGAMTPEQSEPQQ